MAKLHLNKQKQWTCDSTGSGIANANNNSNSTLLRRPGKQNYADYWTKHDTAAHHVNIRPEFLTPYIILEMLTQQQQTMTAKAA
jgi:hypothetical protein